MISKEEVARIFEDAKKEGVPDLRELAKTCRTNNEVIENTLPGFADFYSAIFMESAGDSNLFRGFMAEISTLSYYLSCNPNIDIQGIIHMAFYLGRYSVLKAKH